MEQENQFCLPYADDFHIIEDTKEFQNDRGELRNFMIMSTEELVKDFFVAAAAAARAEAGTSNNRGHDNGKKIMPSGEALFPLLFFIVLPATIAKLGQDVKCLPYVDDILVIESQKAFEDDGGDMSYIKKMSIPEIADI